jgi:hypothetical protein
MCIICLGRRETLSLVWRHRTPSAQTHVLARIYAHAATASHKKCICLERCNSDRSSEGCCRTPAIHSAYRKSDQAGRKHAEKVMTAFSAHAVIAAMRLAVRARWCIHLKFNTSSYRPLKMSRVTNRPRAAGLLHSRYVQQHAKCTLVT